VSRNPERSAGGSVAISPSPWDCRVPCGCSQRPVQTAFLLLITGFGNQQIWESELRDGGRWDEAIYHDCRRYFL